MFTKEELGRLIQAVKENTNDVAHFTIEVYRAGRELSQAQFSLVEVLAQAYRDGQIEGKNEAERKAHEKVLFANQFANIEKLSDRLEGAKCDLKVAEGSLAVTRFMLRVYELSASIKQDEPRRQRPE
jgi:hypothetical protein